VPFLLTILKYFVFDVKIDLDIVCLVKAMAYVPPHLRKTNSHQLKADDSKMQNERVKLTLDSSEKNFPVLTQSPNFKVSPTTNKFVELADTWRETDESVKKEQEFKKLVKSPNDHFVLPRFVPSRKYKEPDVVENVITQPVEQDEWTQIVRKKRAPKPEKNFEEMEKEMQAKEKEDEDTVWDNQGEESCWND